PEIGETTEASPTDGLRTISVYFSSPKARSEATEQERSSTGLFEENTEATTLSAATKLIRLTGIPQEPLIEGPTSPDAIGVVTHQTTPEETTTDFPEPGEIAENRTFTTSGSPETREGLGNSGSSTTPSRVIGTETTIALGSLEKKNATAPEGARVNGAVTSTLSVSGSPSAKTFTSSPTKTSAFSSSTSAGTETTESFTALGSTTSGNTNVVPSSTTLSQEAGLSTSEWEKTTPQGMVSTAELSSLPTTAAASFSSATTRMQKGPSSSESSTTPSGVGRSEIRVESGSLEKENSTTSEGVESSTGLNGTAASVLPVFGSTSAKTFTSSTSKKVSEEGTVATTTPSAAFSSPTSPGSQIIESESTPTGGTDESSLSTTVSEEDGPSTAEFETPTSNGDLLTAEMSSFPATSLSSSTTSIQQKEHSGKAATASFTTVGGTNAVTFRTTDAPEEETVFGSSDFTEVPFSTIFK
ncbi:hypothetical protein TELCIR_24337, partial [Teladorsagia circumcincta]